MDNQRIGFTPEVIAQQRAICDAATDGKWNRCGFGGTQIWAIREGGSVLICAQEESADGMFIVAAKAGYRAALDALEASMAREAEKDAKIEEQGNRIKFLEDHILRTTRAYKKSRDKLLDERDRLTAERDAEKRRADAAVHAAVHKCWMVHKAGEAGYPEPRIVAGRCFGYGGADDEPMCDECEACGLCVDNTFAHTGPCAENTDALTGAESEAPHA